MLFLEDQAPKRATVVEKSGVEAKLMSEIPSISPDEPRYIGEPHLVLPERNDSIPTRRASLFSRRRGSSHIGNSLTNSRRISVAEMTVAEIENFTSKLFGFASHKKSVERKHGKESASVISAPFGFHHVARIERSVKANHITLETIYNNPPPSASIITPSPELQTSLARRSHQPKLPPIRPRRPHESQIPKELLSPEFSLKMSVIRPTKSNESFTQQTQQPQQPQQPSKPPSAPLFSSVSYKNPSAPRRSNRRPFPYSLDEVNPKKLPSLPKALDMISPKSSSWDKSAPQFSPTSDNRREYQAMSSTSSQKNSDSDNYIHVVPASAPYFTTLMLERVIEEPEGLATPTKTKDKERHPSIRYSRSVPNISTTLLPISTTSSPEAVQLPAILRSESFKSKNKPKKENNKSNKSEDIAADRPTSQCSDTLGEISNRSFSIPLDGDKLKSKRNRNQSWEDDVDFCYKHAAESDCQFDWNNISRFIDDTSDEEDLSDSSISLIEQRKGSTKSDISKSTTSLYSDFDCKDKSFFNQSMVTVAEEGLPELDDVSSHSDSSKSLGPDNAVSSEPIKRNKAKAILGIISPSLPFKSDVNSDSLYEDLMVEFDMKHASRDSLPILEPKIYSPTPSNPMNATTSPMFSPRAPPQSAPLLQRPFTANQTLPPLPLSARTLASLSSSESLKAEPFSTPVPETTTETDTATEVANICPLPPSKSASKDLPPIPPADPSPMTSPSPIPPTLRINSMINALRSPDLSPELSPSDATPIHFPSPSYSFQTNPSTPPTSTKPSPIPSSASSTPLTRPSPPFPAFSSFTAASDKDMPPPPEPLLSRRRGTAAAARSLESHAAQRMRALSRLMEDLPGTPPDSPTGLGIDGADRFGCAFDVLPRSLRAGVRAD